jgi:hypothetical protein
MPEREARRSLDRLRGYLEQEHSEQTGVKSR